MTRACVVTRACVLQVSKKLDADQIEAVFAKFDANGDGRLSMEEFKQMMNRGK